MLCNRPPRLTWVQGLALAWLAYTALALLWSEDLAGAQASLLDLVLLVGVICLCDGEAALRGAGAGLCLLGGLACWEWSVGLSPGQILGNPNYLGEAGALGIFWALAGRRQVTALACLACVLLSGSRASLVGLGLVGLVWFYQGTRGVWARILLGDVVLCAGFWALVFWRSDSLLMREHWWEVALGHLQVFGWGPGSFWTTFPKFNTEYFIDLANAMQERPEWPHNEVVDLVFTLGLGAIFPVLFAIVIARSAPSWALVASVPILLLGFPLHLPTSILLLGALVEVHSRSLPELGLVLRTWRAACSSRLAAAWHGASPWWLGDG